MTEPTYLFQAERLIGTVVAVHADSVRVNLPLASAQEPQLRHGERVGAGEVGEFVIVEAGEFGIFGRITQAWLPERDRLSVEPKMGSTGEAHPLGMVQLMTSLPLDDSPPRRGIARFPRVGARVYSVEPERVAWIADHAGSSEEASALRLDLASLPGSSTVSIRLTPERLFGRHCAVLGATGGGKSWTVARIIERCADFNAKVILLDATGEYHTLRDRVRHVSVGATLDRPAGCTAASVPYRDLEEGDLFALLRPSGQVQGPRLREAMKSLKLAVLVADDDDFAELVENGVIVKADRAKRTYEEAYAAHAATVDRPNADFDIRYLAQQIACECVYPSAFGRRPGERDHLRWGSTSDADYSYCAPLVGRIESYINTAEFAPVFQPDDIPSVFEVLDSFLNTPEESILRISLRHLSFKQDIREIVANGIARRLLAFARDGLFAEQPLVICVDEAHQFLNKSLGDEYSKWPLDAFDLIAKEGRKYSLSICIATQRPRDIPDAVMGQMGTLLVHRLTNHRDRETVERAAGDVDQSAIEFLPSLAQGQAVLLGVDFPIPLTIQVTPPKNPPDSQGPDFQSHWQRRR